MAWHIHAWNRASSTGSVVSPHFGPLSFGDAQNPGGTTDFAPGEEIAVQLGGSPGNYVVTSVRHLRPCPQPEGTECAVFAVVNARGFADAGLEEGPPGELRLWLGWCCAWCGPFARVSFRGVTQVVGGDDDGLDADSPQLRFASDDEVRGRGLHVGEGARAYCVVASPKLPHTDASADLFVVAEQVSVSFHPAAHHAPPDPAAF